MDVKIDKFDHKVIENKWQIKWSELRLNEADIQNAKRPFYNLMMFPYPSAEGLHIGNMYAFTGSDIYGRYKQMKGFNVFEPIGLDGFGIHSENYALKIGRHPMDHAKITQKNYYDQLLKIGSMYDWGRTLETYDPNYYRWTQWLFVQMFKNGLAYRKRASVNYCPSCKTVLADEQVLPATKQDLMGSCERCGNIVEKRLLEQWFFRITAYAGKLHDNISALNWSEIVKTAQTNWIGKKTGINISYSVVDRNNNPVGDIVCFTTRPDTNYGATFVVIAPEHPFITHILQVIDFDKRETINQYLNVSLHKSEIDRLAEGKEKTGVFTNLYCINNLNGYRMPLYISDFVLMGFGTGAVVGVPGHDIRDFEFAQVFKIPVIRVVKTGNNDGPITHIEDVQEEEGTMINSGFLNGMGIHQATTKIMDYLESRGWGKRETVYHLRDWLISRQRYWGPPIPMIYCKTCSQAKKSWFTTSQAIKYQSKMLSDNKSLGQNSNQLNEMAGWYPVPDDQLPVILPRIEDYKPGDDGVAPLAKHQEFYEVNCPECGGKAVRETDVSDTFLDSSWYFLRYASLKHEIGSMKNEECGQKIHNSSDKTIKIDSASQFPWDPEITKKWLPVDMYTGGAEHSVLHLLYSRFVTMALHDWGYLNFDEPFKNFYAHGLVIKDGAKMSKSKGNVVNPDQYIETYGSDALRLYLMFMGPFSQGGDFRDSSMEGMSRWVGRVWRLGIASVNQIGDKQDSKNQQSIVHLAKITTALQNLIIKVGDDLEKRRYNTAIASMMEFTNFVADNGGVLPVDMLKKFILLLAPFAPFLSEELWQIVNNQNDTKIDKNQSVHAQSWPSIEGNRIQQESVKIVIQVNGKLRDLIEVPYNKSSDKKYLEQIATQSKKVSPYISGQTVKKYITIPGKLVNIVI
jgi:leucyl-tRNA synthetase